MSTPIAPQRRLDLAPVAAGDTLLRVTADFDAQLNIATFNPDARTFRLIHLTWPDGEVADIAATTTVNAIPFGDHELVTLQRLPQGGWLLVLDRSLEEGGEYAVVIDAAGETTARLDLGADLASVQVDQHGRIWVAYEASLDGGVRCFGPDGAVLFELDPSPDSEWFCYGSVINVSGDEAYVLFNDPNYEATPETVEELREHPDRYLSGLYSLATVIDFKADDIQDCCPAAGRAFAVADDQVMVGGTFEEAELFGFDSSWPSDVASASDLDPARDYDLVTSRGDVIEFEPSFSFARGERLFLAPETLYTGDDSTIWLIDLAALAESGGL